MVTKIHASYWRSPICFAPLAQPPLEHTWRLRIRQGTVTVLGHRQSASCLISTASATCDHRWRGPHEDRAHGANVRMAAARMPDKAAFNVVCFCTFLILLKPSCGSGMLP